MSTQNLYSKFDRIFDLMPELIFVLDEKGIIADYNRTAAQLIGRDDLTGKQMMSIVPEGRQPEFLSYLTSDGKRFDSQFLTGSAKALDVSVQIKQLESMERTFSVVIARDMTEQKQRDLDFLRFSNVIERTINPIQITDAHGLMIYMNPAFEKWSGYSKEELIGKNPKLLRSNKHSRQFWQHVWRTILGGKVWQGQVENRRKDGAPLHTELLISPIIDDEAEVVGFLGAHRDITEQKMLEQQLVQSQKMESIGTLAAGIAHEVGNPLTSISSLVQVIQRTTSDDFAKEKLELIKNQVGRISRTIRDLVDFSRPSTHTVRSTDVNQVVRDALNIVKYGKKVREITFHETMGENLPLLMIVPDQLTQVFINILINAVDALQGKPGSIWIQTALDTNNIEIAIRDSGTGISREDKEKIFDPFFTTKEIGKGSGLGLWVSYGIVKNFGGDILVESEPGTGSTFKVLLPLKGAQRG
ncbi:MAG: PAS domain S-box protein [Ignavibacteriae bacterium]|nr:PAS domain S-box protein [Ignavibacteriota bacterium]